MFCVLRSFLAPQQLSFVHCYSIPTYCPAYLLCTSNLSAPELQSFSHSMALNDIIILLKVVAFSSLRQLLDHLKGKAREAISTRSLTAGRVLLPCCEQRMCSDSADDKAGRTCTAQVSAWTDRTLQQKLEQTSPQQAWSDQLLPLQGDPVRDALAALLPLPCG